MGKKLEKIWNVIFLVAAVAGTFLGVAQGDAAKVTKGFVTTLFAIALFFFDTPKENKVVNAAVYIGMAFLILYYFRG